MGEQSDRDRELYLQRRNGQLEIRLLRQREFYGQGEALKQCGHLGKD